jgi:hypothetical protein
MAHLDYLRRSEMKRHHVLTGAVVTILLVVATGLVQAHGTTPERETRTQAALGPGGFDELTTSFTYQGHLTDGGSPANGPYDFEFKLYDAPTDGTTLGTLTVKNFPVSEGLFTVPLDFGAGVFTGDARWLEIGVRPGLSSGAYTLLSPRQALTATPYALYAQRVAEHDHLGQTWTGSDNPLVMNGSFGPSDYAPLVLSNSHASGDGLRVDSAGDAGLHVKSAGGRGVSVDIVGSPSGASTTDSKDGFAVAGAEGNGLYVGQADRAGVFVGGAGDDGVSVGGAKDDGVSVFKAGAASATTASTDPNGFEVAGAEGHGLYVGRADQVGAYVESAASTGMYVNEAGWDGLSVGSSGHNGLYVYSADNDGVFVRSAGDDGIYVSSAGSPSEASASTGHNGLEVAGAEGHGLCVGRADEDGVHVDSAGGDGVYVHRAGDPSTVSPSAYHWNGFEVAGAWDDGLYIGWAGGDGVYVDSVGRDGVHVEAADHYAGYFNGDVRITGELDVTDGSAVGFFPGPAWDSGWRAIPACADRVWTHGLGGDVDNYVVDMQFKDTDEDGIHFPSGINIIGHGGHTDVNDDALGAYWRSLTDSSIAVVRYCDAWNADQIRIRIWVYK